jgi:hypothetical protein
MLDRVDLNLRNTIHFVFYHINLTIIGHDCGYKAIEWCMLENETKRARGKNYGPYSINNKSIYIIVIRSVAVFGHYKLYGFVKESVH